MTQQDRGAYTPQTDAPLAFDARAPRGARRPLPFALIGSGVVLLALVVAVILYYAGGSRGPGGAPPTVGEPVSAMKTAPPQGETDDPFSNLDVYASQNVPATPDAPKFAPPPEQPQPRGALSVQTVEPSAVHPAPSEAPPAAPAAPKPAPAHAAPTAVAAAPAKPVPAKPAPAPPAAPVAVAAGGPAMVQIGAFSSTALAEKGYSDVAAAFPSQMAGKSRRVEPLSRDGKTLYRGLIAGFSDRGAAQAFCDALKAAGRTCLVRG